MYKAKDIMTRAVICTRPTMQIYQAVRLLISRRVASLPVVDEKLNLLGCLYEKDVLPMVYGCQEDENKTVADFMTRVNETLGPDARLIEMCDGILNSGSRSFPVTFNGKLLGVISRSDLVRTLLRLKHQELKESTLSPALT